MAEKEETENGRFEKSLEITSEGALSNYKGLLEKKGLKRLSEPLKKVTLVQFDRSNDSAAGYCYTKEGEIYIALRRDPVEGGNGASTHEMSHALHFCLNPELRRRSERMQHTGEIVGNYREGMDIGGPVFEREIQAAVALDSGVGPRAASEAKEKAGELGINVENFKLGEALVDYYLSDYVRDSDLTMSQGSGTVRLGFTLRLYESLFGIDDDYQEMFSALQEFYRDRAKITDSLEWKEKFKLEESAREHLYKVPEVVQRRVERKIEEEVRGYSDERLEGVLREIGGEDIIPALQIEYYARQMKDLSPEQKKEALKMTVNNPSTSDLELQEMAYQMNVQLMKNPGKLLPDPWETDASSQMKTRQQLISDLDKALDEGKTDNPYVDVYNPYVFASYLSNGARRDLTDEMRKFINLWIFNDWPPDFDPNSEMGKQYIEEVRRLTDREFADEVWSSCAATPLYEHPQIEYSTGDVWGGKTPLEMASTEEDKEELMGQQTFYGHQNNRVDLSKGFETLQAIENLEYFGIKHGESPHYGQGNKERVTKGLRERAFVTAKDLARIMIQQREDKLFGDTVAEPFAFTMQKYICGDKIGRYTPGFFGDGYSWTLSSFEAPQNFAALHIGIIKLMRDKNTLALSEFLSARNIDEQIEVLRKHDVYFERANRIMTTVRGGKVESSRAL